MGLRGGARAWAGRRKTLTWDETIVVAGRVERYRLAVLKARLKRKKAAYFAKSDYHASIAKLGAVPIRDRVRFLSSHEAADIFDDIEFARHEMAKTIDGRAQRLLTFALPRLYGLQPRIFMKVASWSSWRFGRPVSPRAVERAWKLIRRAAADHGSDVAGL